MKNRLLYLLLTFCSISGFSQDKLQIKGNIKGIPNDAKLTLQSNFQKKEFQLNDGMIDVEMELNEVPSLVYIMMEHNGDYKYTTFFVGNENIVLNGSVDDFPNNIKAENSKYDELRYKECLLTKRFDEEMEKYSKELDLARQKGMSRDSLYDIYMRSEEPVGKIQKVMKERDMETFEFVRENINTDYGRYLLRFSLSQFSTEQFKMILALIDPKYKYTQEVVFIQTIVDSKQLDKGDKYYDFKALDVNEKEISFSSFFTGKYVLIDFSTLHCGFCIKAAPQTIKIAENLKDKLTYVTYYVDQDIEGIKEYYALKENKGSLIWNKKGRLEPIIAKYRQNGTPRFILFDPNGVLVKDFIGLEKDFEKQLKELIK